MHDNLRSKIQNPSKNFTKTSSILKKTQIFKKKKKSKNLG